MNSQQIGLLCIQFAVSLGVAGFLGISTIRAKEKQLTYSLFAARDKLLYLAATGVLPETSMVFKVFYKAINRFIAEMDSVTIVSFARASIAVRDELEKENRQKLIDSLMRADPQVREVVDDFFQSMMKALRRNSPMLTLVLIFARHCATAFRLARKLLGKLLPKPLVYETYRFYENIHGTMHTT